MRLGGQESFAQIWMHNEMLQVDGKKMSKSKQNFLLIDDYLNILNHLLQANEIKYNHTVL